ncbi:MAG TPA: serine hydrolase domain-containing protein [Longimicrobiales bacterium]
MIAAALISALVIQAPPQLSTTTDPRIDALARSVVGSKTPGLAVVVVQRGKVVHADAYGDADPAAKTRFTLQTPSYIASVGKMFTAFAILQQIDRGKVAFDTRLGDVLPDAPAYAKGVTIRQLLNHTSGLADHLDIGGDDKTYSYDDVIRILNDADSLLFTPESRSSYSNSAYILLARVLERITGRTFEDYLGAELFKPTGMQTATVVTANNQRPAGRVVGYRLESGALRMNDYQASSTKGAGGMYASAQDLYRWAVALRRGSLLRAETLKTASTPAVRTNGRPTPWGMGWLAEFHGERDPLKGKTYVAANGQLGGFQASVKWYQEEDLFIIWLANSNSPDVFDAMHRIAALMLLPAQ